MSTVIATSSGSVVIGESGSVPLAEGVIGSVTPTVTMQSKGQLELASATATAADMKPQEMATMLFIHLRFFDTTNDAPRNVASILLNGTITVVDCQEFLWSSADAASGMTAMIVTSEATNPTRVEFEIAGV